MSDREKAAPLADEVLADRLGLTAGEFRRYRAQGLISVVLANDDTAGIRVACRLGNRIWEGLVQDNTVIFEEVRYLRGPRSRRLPR